MAVVVAFDYPQAESDLAVYRSQYGLPPCTSLGGCFRKVDQSGGSSYPAASAGWAQEAATDIEMVSAVCPKCHILLVEANTSALDDMFVAENTAASLGATSITNSWGVPESWLDASSANDSAFRHPGIAVTAAAGNGGYSGGPLFPATSNAVTSVGGTSLVRDSSTRGWSETAFSKGGSGCSAFFAKPAWQTDTGCGDRTVADVAAVADPKTGVAVYDSFDDGAGHSGWMVFGGTSVATAVVAGIYGLAGNNPSAAGPDHLYANTGSLNDVTSGSNGSCSPLYLCTAGPGYDGPTGLGTPAGIAAF